MSEQTKIISLMEYLEEAVRTKEKRIFIFNDLYKDYTDRRDIANLSKGAFKIALAKFCKANSMLCEFEITNFGKKSYQLVLVQPQVKALQFERLIINLCGSALAYASRKMLENEMFKSK